MREFFLNLNRDYYINIFSSGHILIILITFSLLVLIIKMKDKIKNIKETRKKLIRIIIAIILIINMLVRRGSFIYYGVYNWQYHMDINFCNFTSIMFIIYGLSGNKKILNICYYMSYIGPFMAIILPSVNFNPCGYAFYSFLLIHNFVFLASHFLVFMDDYKWANKNKNKAIIFLIIYYITIFMFDAITKFEYNYPLSFINDRILKLGFINSIASNVVLVYMIYFLIILGLIFIGDFIIKKNT